MNDEINDMKIQQYVDNEMPQAERMDFESQLEKSDNLQRRVEAYRLIARGVARYGQRLAWQEVQQFEAEALQADVQQRSFRSKWFYRGMAACLFMIMAGAILYWQYWQQNEQRYSRLFAENFEPYQPLGGPTRGEGDEQSVLPEAFAAYYEQDYVRAAMLLEQATVQEDRPYVWFYLGNAQLAGDQPQEAIAAFQQVFTYAEVGLRMEWRTRWYLGLAYLKTNQEALAAEQFEAIQDTEDYGPQASDILQSIH